MNGLKKVTNRIRNKEVVVSKTDKSSKLCIDKVENYKEAVDDHTTNDQ